MTKETVFERCVTLDSSALLHERLIGWTGRWNLMGNFVVCTQCLAAQSIDLANQPFEHLAECVARDCCKRPWHELQRLLSEIPPLPEEPSIEA